MLVKIDERICSISTYTLNATLRPEKVAESQYIIGFLKESMNIVEENANLSIKQRTLDRERDKKFRWGPVGITKIMELQNEFDPHLIHRICNGSPKHRKCHIK